MRGAARNAAFSLGSLFAVDANGKPTDALTYDFVPVKGNPNQVIITVTQDNDYLTAADRAFPVVIDPTVTVTVSSSQTADTCVCSYFPSTNYYLGTNLRTGYDSDYGIRRSYLRFEIPDSITAGSIIDATLDLEKVSGVVPTVRAYRVTSSWSSSTLTWNNKPGHTTSGQSSQSVVFRAGSAWYTMNVMSIVNNWVNGYSLNYGFVLIDNTENNANHWTTYYSSDAVSPHKPELIITYSDADEITPPPAPSISLNYSSLSIEVGSAQQLVATASPSGSTISWVSSDTSIATVNSNGRITPLYPGKTTITASISGASAQCEVTVIPQGGYVYDVYVNNYYDQAFAVRYSNWSSVISSAYDTAASRLASIFGLRVRSYTYSHTSKADDCKTEAHGSVTGNNIDWQGCSHLIKCNTTFALLTKFINNGLSGSSVEPSVLWTGHLMYAPDEDRSVAVTFLHDVVITPEASDYHHTFLHELSHMLGAHDHYCYGKDDSGKCKSKYCDDCVYDMELRSCVMSEAVDVDNHNDATLYCSDCLNNIRTHLRDHH